VHSILVGGGVSANSLLRVKVKAFGDERGLPVFLPAMAYCVDNAAMIAGMASVWLDSGHRDDLTLPAIATSRVR